MFLEVSALNTQFSISNELNANTVLGEGDSYLGIGGRVIAQETPTVSYTPLKGAEFVRRILDPIDLDTLFLLESSGWSSERLFRLLVDEMNKVGNARGSTGPTPARAPVYEEFKNLASVIGQLQQEGLVLGGSYNNQTVLIFDSEARNRADYLKFTSDLNLNPDKLTFPIMVAATGGDVNSIYLRLRSLSGVMYFLSQSVEVPEEDIAVGRVTVTLDKSGQVFDWQGVTEGVMRIRSSQELPDNASVAVEYRDSWFYIDDSDLDSKSTFLLLGQIYQLQAGDATTIAPVLTLPVGS